MRLAGAHPGRSAREGVPRLLPRRPAGWTRADLAHRRLLRLGRRRLDFWFALLKPALAVWRHGHGAGLGLRADGVGAAAFQARELASPSPQFLYRNRFDVRDLEEDLKQETVYKWPEKVKQAIRDFLEEEKRRTAIPRPSDGENGGRRPHAQRGPSYHLRTAGSHRSRGNAA
jgi:hypothetical protein